RPRPARPRSPSPQPTPTSSTWPPTPRWPTPSTAATPSPSPSRAPSSLPDLGLHVEDVVAQAPAGPRPPGGGVAVEARGDAEQPGQHPGLALDVVGERGPLRMTGLGLGLPVVPRDERDALDLVVVEAGE